MTPGSVTSPLVETRPTPPFRVLATDVAFPEGPTLLPDGSLLVCEVAAGRIARFAPDGTRSVFAEPGGSPSGLALGADGMVYGCNGGGSRFRRLDGLLQPWGASEHYAGGRIERFDPDTGAVETLYDSCDGHRLSSPNDIACDAHGGFWFTDLGKTVGRARGLGGVYYARCDGSGIRAAIWPMETPNGIALSADGNRLYVAETQTRRLWAFDILEPGVARVADSRWKKGDLLASLPGLCAFDGMAVQADGAICVATLLAGGITRVAPDGSRLEHVPFPDTYVTNLCFTGPDLHTAVICLGSRETVILADWDAAGSPMGGQASGSA